MAAGPVQAADIGKTNHVLTLERSKTVDEEISAKVIDFLDRNDPLKTGKPFFVWYNPARMHVTTMLSDKYLGMLGVQGLFARSAAEQATQYHALKAVVALPAAII